MTLEGRNVFRALPPALNPPSPIAVGSPDVMTEHPDALNQTLSDSPLLKKNVLAIRVKATLTSHLVATCASAKLPNGEVHTQGRIPGLDI